MPNLGINFQEYDRNPKYRAFVDSSARATGLDLDEYRRNTRYRSWVDSQSGDGTAPARVTPLPAPKPEVPDDRSGLENFGRGVMSGLSRAGTSLVGGAGYLGELLGAEDNALQRFARETEQEAREYYDPQGRAGTVGKFIGEAAGGIATGVGTAKLAGRALLSAAPRAAAALQGAAPIGQRVAAQVAVNAPIDVLQGMSQERGVVLPGRAGAVLENVGFSALGGLLPGRPTAPTTAPTAGAAGTRAATPTLKEGVETTGRKLETATERIARDGDAPANVNPEDYFNVARLSDDPDVQQRLLSAGQRAIEETDIPGRLPRKAGETLGRLEEQETFDALRARVARDVGISPAEVAARTARGERIGRDDLLRVRTAMAQVANEENAILKRMKEANDGTRPFASAEEAAAAEVTRNRLRREQNALFNVLSAQKKETARDLSAMRIAALQTNDPAIWVGRLQELAKRSLSDAERLSIYAAAEANDIDTLMRLGRDMQKSTLGEKVVAYFRANLLTNPKTHLVNVTGNVGMRALETVKDVPAALFDALISRATGVRTKDLNLADLATMGMRGARQGVEDAKQVLLRGDIDPRTLDIPRQANFDSPLANAYVNGVFRLLSAEDKFFHTMAYTRSLEEQARLLAKAEGARGAQLADRVQVLVRKPSAQMEAQAILDANVATFKQDSEIANALMATREKLGRILRKVTGASEQTANIIMPFVKTPGNIASTIIDYSPIGTVRPLLDLGGLIAGKSAKAAKQREVVDALGRSSVGSAAILYGYMLAKDDKMTGFYPMEEKKQREWEMTGRTEGSARIGDSWVQVNRLSPLGNLMTIGAALHQLEQEDPDVAGVIVGSLTAPASAVYDLPMVSGVRDLFESLRPGAAGKRGEKLAQYLGRTTQGFIPAAGLVRGVARTIDTTARQTRTDGGKTVGRMIQSGLPGASQQLPERLTGLGESMERGGLQSILSPVNISRARTATDPVLREIERTGATPMPLEQLRGESDATFDQRQRNTGRVIRNVIGSVMRDSAYLGVQRADPTALRQFFDAKNIDTGKLTDEQVRTRYQRYILDQAIERAKSAVGEFYPKPRLNTAQTRRSP